jgi:HEAT repeat protein
VQLDPEQLDLFAWPTQADAGRSQPAVEPPARPSDAVDVGRLPTPALLRALDRLLDGAIQSAGTNRRLIEEVAQRRLAGAIPTLVGICRLHAGFDRARTVPEVVAAVEALSALGAASAACDVLRLAEQNALGPAALAAALRFFAAVRLRPSASFARLCLVHEDATVRADACLLLAELGQQDAIGRLRELGADAEAAVAAAADLARGHLGDTSAKLVLEQRLRAAPANEVPPIARALIGIADSDTVVLLGRAAEHAEIPVRVAIVEALGEIDLPPAVAWLLRFAGDSQGDVRVAVANGLAEHDDPRVLAALQRLAADADPEVRGAADASLSEIGRRG